MDDLLIQEYIMTVIESRLEDFERIKAGNESWDAILNYIHGLEGDPKNFARVFQTENGYFTGFALGARIRKKEHIKLSVFFLDRSTFGVRGKVNAQATRIKVQPENPQSAALKSFRISIYLDAPTEAKVSAKAYNNWLAGHLEGILDDPSIRSSYVHEFIHVLDFKRMDPQYLNQRGQKKAQDRERRQQAGEKATDFVAYANDPLELNAYFSQAMSDVQTQLKNANPEERKVILGSSPQEFADRFMSLYLKKQIRKNISPENALRLMKRAATSWEYLNQSNEET